MHALRRLLGVLLLVTPLAACFDDGSSQPPVESQPPPQAVNLTKVSGDNQSVLQHAAMDEPLVVQVTDATGEGLQGTTVSFTAGPGSGNFRVADSVTDQFAEAFLRTYFHSAGTQRVVATVDGYPPVTFTVNVLPAGQPMDGVYKLAYSGIVRDPAHPDVALPISASVQIGIRDGQLVDITEVRTTTWIVNGSFSPVDGSLAVSFRVSTDTGASFLGYLSLDGSTAGGSGTWVELWRGRINPDTGGNWTAERL
jgi:hypothetical protein